MTKAVINYIKQELKYLKEVNGSLIDTTTNEVFNSRNEWFLRYFNVTESEFKVSQICFK